MGIRYAEDEQEKRHGVIGGQHLYGLSCFRADPYGIHGTYVYGTYGNITVFFALFAAGTAMPRYIEKQATKRAGAAIAKAESVLKND